MAKLKFRIWDKHAKRMIYSNNKNFLISLDGRIIARAISDKDEDVEVTKQFITMQYVGIKDFNLKEIYDGDILECTGDEIKRGKFVVGESGNCFDDADYLKAEIEGYMSGLGIVWKVIGNVYENPEILKDIYEYEEE